MLKKADMSETKISNIKAQYIALSKSIDHLRGTFYSMDCKYSSYEKMGDGMEAQNIKVCNHDDHPDRKYGSFQFCDLKSCPL